MNVSPDNTIELAFQRHHLQNSDKEDDYQQVESGMIYRLLNLSKPIEYKNKDGLVLTVVLSKSYLICRIFSNSKLIYKFSTTLMRPKGFSKTPVEMRTVLFENTTDDAREFLSLLLETFRKGLLIRQVAVRNTSSTSNKSTTEILQYKDYTHHDELLWGVSVECGRHIKILPIQLSYSKSKAIEFTNYHKLKKELLDRLLTNGFFVSTLL